METTSRTRIDTEAALHTAMVATNNEDPKHPVKLEGNTRREEKKAQRAAVAHAAGMDALEGIAEHPLDVALERKFEGKIDGFVIAGPKAAWATIKAVYLNIQDEGSLDAATRRESAIGACALLCQGVLPEGYRSQVLCGLIGANPLPGDANIHPQGPALVTSILAAPGGKEVALAIVASCQQGEQKALALGLHSQAELDATLNLNPEFAHRYGSDLAFRMGVDAAVWASAHGEPLPGATGPTELSGWAAGIKTG